jgi:hypothetical protein
MRTTLTAFFALRSGGKSGYTYLDVTKISVKAMIVYIFRKQSKLSGTIIYECSHPVVFYLLNNELQNSSQNTTYNIDYALQRHFSTRCRNKRKE